MPRKNAIIFILLSFFKIIINEKCNIPSGIPIENRNDCFVYSTPKAYCCYNSEGEDKCQLVPKNDLSSKSNLDCGITNENYGKYEFGQYHPKQVFTLEGFQGCGVFDPKDKEDCIEYSELSNSCCFFKKGVEKACFSIGKKFDGKNTKFNYKDYEVECNSSNIILTIYSLLFLIFIF